MTSCACVSNRAILVRPHPCFLYDVTVFFLHHTESPMNQIETDAGLKLETFTDYIDTTLESEKFHRFLLAIT